MDNAALHSPAAERNKGPILAQLLQRLPPQGLGLEIASGSGQHIAALAAALPGWQWLASDPLPTARASIRALWPAGPTPLALDVRDAEWPLPASHQQLDAVLCINMLHISPWSSCAALMRGAARHLRTSGCLMVYGPFLVPGLATAASNLAFDADLRARDPAWGLRGLDAVEAEACSAGLRLCANLELPANNRLLVFVPEERSLP